MVASAITMGSRGTLVVPKSIRKALGYSDGCLLLLEVDSGSLRIRKAVAMPVDEYTKERAAQLILNASVDAEDYQKSLAKVRAMGLDPTTIPHDEPE